MLTNLPPHLVGVRVYAQATSTPPWLLPCGYAPPLRSRCSRGTQFSALCPPKSYPTHPPHHHTHTHTHTLTDQPEHYSPGYLYARLHTLYSHITFTHGDHPSFLPPLPPPPSAMCSSGPPCLLLARAATPASTSTTASTLAAPPARTALARTQCPTPANTPTGPAQLIPPVGPWAEVAEHIKRRRAELERGVGGGDGGSGSSGMAGAHGGMTPPPPSPSSSPAVAACRGGSGAGPGPTSGPHHATASDAMASPAPTPAPSPAVGVAVPGAARPRGMRRGSAVGPLLQMLRESGALGA